MSRENKGSNVENDTVAKFKEIKAEAGCDDLTAAILTLAESVQWITATVQISENGYPERLGGDIAKAITDAAESFTQGGAVNVSPGAFKGIKAGSQTPAKKKR